MKARIFEYDVSDFDREDIVIQKGIIRKIFQNLAGKLRNIEANHVNDVLILESKWVNNLTSVWDDCYESMV